MGQPPPHPGPPADFQARKLAVIEFADVLYRTHRRDRSPIFFGRSGRNRFDDPRGLYGVLYAARDPHGAFIETFGQVTGHRSISTAGLQEYGLVRLVAHRPLRLIDLTAPGFLARIGADSRLFAGEYELSQAWSRAFFEHPYAAADGILYPARHDPTRQAAALFERGPRIEAVTCQAWHDGGPLRPLLAAILDHYGFELIETVLKPERKRPGYATEMSQMPLTFD